MAKYTVTTELKTLWWLKLLRFFRIKNKREEFKIIIGYNRYKKGQILENGFKTKMKIVWIED